MDFLQAFDIRLFHWINGIATAPALDWFFANITNLHREWWFSFVIVPVVIGLAFWIKGKVVIHAVLALAMTIAICDMLNHRVFKANFQRDRPFKVAELNAQLKIEEARGHSFPSNHAANMMAGAVILSAYFPPVTLAFVSVAVLVGYSRPYLGVHFPMDVLAGWLIGALLAYLILLLIRRLIPKIAPPAKGIQK